MTDDVTHYLISFKPTHDNISRDISIALEHLVDETGRTETGALFSVRQLPQCFTPDLTRLPAMSTYAAGEIISTEENDDE